MSTLSIYLFLSVLLLDFFFKSQLLPLSELTLLFKSEPSLESSSELTPLFKSEPSSELILFSLWHSGTLAPLFTPALWHWHWIEKFIELKRRNMTSLLRWGCNKIIVHVPYWGYIQVDTKTY
ncbi:unnamed protein product [Camellia sinensis]